MAQHAMLSFLLALLMCLVSPFSCWGFGSAVQRHHRYPTAIFSTVTPPYNEEKRQQHHQQLHQCQGCNRTFKSRNSLFKHLRGEDEASVDCPLASMTATEEELLMTTVLRYGYYDYSMEERRNNGTTSNEFVANMLHNAFERHVHTFLEGYNFTVSTGGLTYSTAAKLRQPSLRQDEEVAGATSEVSSFNYRLSSSPFAIAKWKEYINGGQLQGMMQSWLDDEEHNSQIHIQLHQMDALVPRSSKFYAERSCSQSSYRYLLPVSWILPLNDTGRDEIEAWLEHIIIQQGGKFDAKEGMEHRRHMPRAGNQGQSMGPPRPPSFIKRLKQSLKATESEIVPNRRSRRQAERNKDGSNNTNEIIGSDEIANDSSPVRLAPGRFGQLWRKRRRCWSNFAHPKLTGMQRSPGHEAVWRTMDRAKVVGFIGLHNDNGEDSAGEHERGTNKSDIMQNMHIILEFRADGFVRGQIPRMISALVAMTNGWLPPNFFEIATRPDVYMPAPPAPPFLDKRLYFESARYHFHELTSNGINFASTIRTGSSSEQNWEVDLRKKLWGSAPSMEREEEEWLLDLRDNVSPNLTRQAEAHVDEVTSEHDSDSAKNMQGTSTDLPLVDTGAPDEYSNALELLRDVVNSGKWPATSDARSRVIKSPGGGSQGSILGTNNKGALTSTFPGNMISSGSFTVVNEQIWDVDAMPLGNSLFPELAKAVFDLENEIIRRQGASISAADGMRRQSTTSSLQRSPSTHCAVNRNAQFTPHVDSGRGQGQSVSMIAGLGNYTGGEILVEGEPYDIRYNALEFDGWKQLHWTAPFKGERYSLVWFTPDMSRKSGNGKRQPSEMLLSLDDQHAKRLAEEHSKKVPFLRPLKFRHDSTDGIVINELLDVEKGSSYTMDPNSNMPLGFSLNGHNCVLDVGAHIGVASRLAIAGGCKHIIAYEPEPSNFEMLSQNLDISQSKAHSSNPTVELYSSAVAHQSSESRTMIQARNENDGKENTWRHSLEEYSQYVDTTHELPSKSQKKTLGRISVPCISFFGDYDKHGDKQKGALVAGVSCVKLDCEGAEIDILLSSEAAQRSSWLDATHLVVEWSFTKERRVTVFHQAMDNLQNAGFEIYYEGIGSWWDTDAGVMWPYHKDLIVFGIMRE